ENNIGPVQTTKGHRRVGLEKSLARFQVNPLIACNQRGSGSIAVRAERARPIRSNSGPIAIDCTDGAVESERTGEPPKAGHRVPFLRSCADVRNEHVALRLTPAWSASVCLLVPDRYNCPDGGASHHGIDFEPSADLLQALAHARQPDALRGGVLLADQLTHAVDARHAFAGILDCEHDSVPVRCALAHETDLRRRTPRMSGNVGQSFLHDTEQYQFPIRREPLHRRRDVELHRDAAALLEALNIMASRQPKPRLVE